MESQDAAWSIKPQQALKCYGRRNRSKSQKEQVSDKDRANGKLEDEKIPQASVLSVDSLVSEEQVRALDSADSSGGKKDFANEEKIHGGADSSDGKKDFVRKDEAGDIADSGDGKKDFALPVDISIANAEKESGIPSQGTDTGRDKDAVRDASEVLDAPVVPKDVKEEKKILRFRNEEERLEYEEQILCRRDEVLERQEALEHIKRIPSKCKEPPRRKCHWDYVLEEMQWLAKDFEKERKWKLAQAKRVAQKLAKSQSEAESKGLRKLKGEESRVRRIASNIAKEVKKFWVKIEKLVIYKHQLAVEEKKKKALDKHLDFLLGQTERYSSMLAVNLSGQPQEPSIEERQPETEQVLNEPDGDKDFVCDQMEEEDDEATIDADEAMITETERKEELNALQRESELPIEELMRLYARGDQDENGVAKDDNSVTSDESESESDRDTDDGEFNPDVADGLEEDDERTFDEEEKLALAEGKDNQSELEQLRMESELPVEELLSQYRVEHNESSEGDEKGETSSHSGESTEEVEERTGEPSTSGRDSLMILKEKSNKFMAVENLTETDNEDAQVLANIARAAQQRGERMKRKELGKTGRKELDDAAEAAQSAQPTGYTFSTTNVLTKVPFLLRHSLREYQHIGLDWLVTMYEKRLNGILADEMGLGKTIMTIALLAHLACEKGIWGPHLIVVPTSVMLNWETEFMKWCPAFKVLTYFGHARERKVKRQGWSKANSFHVCITTYRLVIQDAKAFKRKKWKYLILDEAHLIKNWKSQRWQTLLNFNSKRRILLTGTPLQNDLMELWSLMHFLMPHVFQSHQEFKDWFSNPITGMVEGQSKVNQDVVDRLHNVLRPFILRRLKRDVEKQLPGKHEHVVACKLSKRQRNLYEDFMASSDTQATLSSGNFLGLINVLMQLRKVCNHPDLFESRPIVSSFDMPGLELQFCSDTCAALQKHLSSAVDISVLNFLLEHDLESWEQSEMSELAAPRSLIVELASTGDDTWISEQVQPQNIFEEIQLALAIQRRNRRKDKARHFGWLNMLRCNKHTVYSRGLRKSVMVEHPMYDVHKLESDPSRYLEFSSAIADIVKTPVTWCEEMTDVLQAFVFVIPAARAPPPLIWCSSSSQSSESVLKYDFSQDGLSRMSELTAPLRPIFVRRQLFFPDRRLLQFDCGKLQELSVLLRRLKSEGHRALIFTQMTKMLDILESFINLYGYTYMRLDGSTKPEQRQILMQRFNTNPKIFLFILSTRSGGVGINLVGADTVIFYDSDWNPAMDQQAQDRCHRIGQTREVHIYRLVSESTIEENILKKANQKRFLDNLVIQSGSYNTEFFKKLDPMELLSGTATKYSSAEVDAALKSAEDEADYMAMKKVELEEAADIQEFTEDVSVEDDECADDLEDGKNPEPKVPTPPEPEKPIEVHKQAVNHALSELKEQDVQQPVAMDAEEDMDMLADVKQLVAAAAASGLGSNFEDQLKPIERYAIQFIDLWDPIINTDAIETQVNFEEKEWELEQLEKLKEEQEAEIDEDDEPLLYESWDTSLADAAYRQQVEVFTQQQEQLQAEWEEMQKKEMEAAAERMMEPQEERRNKKSKKKKYKSVGRARVDVEHIEVETIETQYEDMDDAADEVEVLSSASEDDADYDIPWQRGSQWKRQLSRNTEDEEHDNKRFKFLRTRFGGKLAMPMMTKKTIITLERDKRKESLRSREAAYPWMPQEDAILVAVVHEYGPNWRLATDALEGLPDGGVYRGRHREPSKCKDRFRQLIVENAGFIGGEEKFPASSSILKVTEEDTKRLLDVVLQVPDTEMLLQRHYAAVLRVKDAHSKGMTKSGKGFMSTVGQPRNLPFISLQTLTQGSLTQPSSRQPSGKGHALVAEALTQSTVHQHNSERQLLNGKLAARMNSNDVQQAWEVSLSFPDLEWSPVHVTIREPKTVEPTDPLSVVRSLLAESRFRASAELPPLSWATSTMCPGPKKTQSPRATLPASFSSGKRPSVQLDHLTKLHKPKQPKLQQLKTPSPQQRVAPRVTPQQQRVVQRATQQPHRQENGMVEIRPVEITSLAFSPSQLKSSNMEAGSPGTTSVTTNTPRVHVSTQQGSTSKSPQDTNRFAQYWRPSPSKVTPDKQQVTDKRQPDK